MDHLPGAAHAGELLKRTALRDFTAVSEVPHRAVAVHRTTVSPVHSPVPVLFKYALTLIGLAAHGPGEKIAWSVDFAYREERCTIAHQKYGLRVYLYADRPPAEAQQTLEQIVRKLTAAVRSAEKVITAAAPDLVREGQVTVINHHRSLDRAYRYFRGRAADPAHVDDVVEDVEPVDGVFLRGQSVTLGSHQMRQNAFHDLVASLTAYVSLLEHTLVLSLAFVDDDPASNDLARVVGDRWADKFKRVLGTGAAANRYRERLTLVIERWRNPYAHGAHEKDHAATLYLHAPGVGAAVPMGLTRARDSPLFAVSHTIRGAEMQDIYALFDEFDDWMAMQLPEAHAWIRAGLDVRFDQDFRRLLRAATAAGEFAGMLEHFEYTQAMVDDMDY